MVTALLTVWFLPALLPMAAAGPGTGGFFLVLHDQFAGMLVMLYQVRPLLLELNLVALGTYLAVLIATEGLSAARLTWHRAAFAEVIAGALNGFVIALALGILILNLLVWVLLFIASIVIGIGVLMAMAAAAAEK